MMSLLVTSFLFLFIIDSAGGTSTTDECICNIKWVNISNVQYAVTDNSRTMSYSTAVTCCQFLNTRLAVFDKEVNGLQVMRAVVAMYPVTEFWVDARRNATTNLFTWPDGSPVNESFWRQGPSGNEPQDADNCARVHSDGTLWGIHCLNHFYSAFCQIYSAKTLVTATSCESGGQNQTASLLSSPNEISPTTDQTSSLSSSLSRQSTTVLQTNQTTVLTPQLSRQSTTVLQTNQTTVLTPPLSRQSTTVLQTNQTTVLTPPLSRQSTTVLQTNQTTVLSPSLFRQSTTVLQTNQTTVLNPSFPRQSTTLTSTFPTKMLTSSTPILCACSCSHHFNLDDTKVEGKLKQIREALSVNTTALSSSVRKKSSSIDSRKSAQAMGLIGTCILVCCGTVIFFIDVMAIFQACK